MRWSLKNRIALFFIAIPLVAFLLIGGVTFCHLRMMGRRLAEFNFWQERQELQSLIVRSLEQYLAGVTRARQTLAAAIASHGGMPPNELLRQLRRDFPGLETIFVWQCAPGNSRLYLDRLGREPETRSLGRDADDTFAALSGENGLIRRKYAGEDIVFTADTTFNRRIKLPNTGWGVLSTSKLQKATPRPADLPAAEADKLPHGLQATVYAGKFNEAAEVDRNGEFLLQTVGNGPNINLAGLPENEFGIVYEGFFYAPVKGNYAFTVNSDDGSVLYIGDQMVVNHDASRWAWPTSYGRILLEAGLHRMKVIYYQGDSDKTLQIFVQPNLDGGGRVDGDYCRFVEP